MLRKRSRAVTNPQAIVGDHSNNSWLFPEKSTKPTSFFFNSPKLFKGFFNNSSSNSSSDSNSNSPSPRMNDPPPPPPPIMSPTSILDTKPFSVFSNAFWIVDNNPSNTTTNENPQHSWEQKGIGLALIDDNNVSETNNTTLSTTKPRRKLVVFGSQLRIQVPPLPQSSVFPSFSPESPREFGIKTPKNNYWRFGNGNKDSQVHPQNISPVGKGMLISGKGNEKLSLSDMELSEDYTCVIHNGPNPKTTHIFGNCVVQSCCGVVGSSSYSGKRNGYLSNLDNSIPSHESFLSFCHNCKKKLGQGSDIYMYRGEKAFCSEECRSQEMVFDGVEK